MAKTNAKKQADFKVRQIKAGLKRKEYWATPEEHEYLKSFLGAIRELGLPIENAKGSNNEQPKR